jgi:hypothetical protein
VAATPRGATRPTRLSRRHDDARRIRRRRIRQFYLHADYRVQPRLMGGRGESNHSVETVVIRDGQPGEPQLYGTGNQFVRRRGSVEE